MQPLQFLVPLGPLEAVADLVPHVVLVLVLANMVTRYLAHRKHVDQAKSDDEDVSRYAPHTATSILLVLASFAYLIVEPHGGMVMSVLVVGLFLADLFELEARQVEARNEMTVEAPKSALAASVLVLLYAAFQSLFFVIAPVWNSVI